MKVDINLVLYMLEAGLLGMVLGLVVGRATFKQASQEHCENGEQPLEQALSLDKALARKFYSDLRKALKEGTVRIVLASELCKGYVAYDFSKQEWICVERDGTTYPLHGKPALEIVEFEEFEEEGGD